MWELLRSFQFPSVSQIAFVVGGLYVLKTLKSVVFPLFASSKPPLYEKNWKKDVVYLYEFDRSKEIPNLSPFCLKVETFLRAHKIPYEPRYSLTRRSRLGLVPFIELNGEHIADSQLIIAVLKKHFNIDDGLDAKDAATSWAIERLTAQNSFFVFLYFKSQGSAFPEYILQGAGIPAFVRTLVIPLFFPIFKRKMLDRVHSVLGDFTDADFHSLLKQDLDTYMNLIGKKKFAFGDTLTTADMAIFGMIGAAYYIPVQNHVKELVDSSEYKTLRDYLNRVRETVWGKDFTSD